MPNYFHMRTSSCPEHMHLVGNRVKDNKVSRAAPDTVCDFIQGTIPCNNKALFAATVIVMTRVGQYRRTRKQLVEDREKPDQVVIDALKKLRI